MKKQFYFSPCLSIALLISVVIGAKISCADPPALTDAELKSVLAFEQQRIGAIEQVIDSVVAIYDEDRSGGGSGVVITPTGIALTNHHVIVGAGVKGWGGMAGDKIYRWKLIGTDPGGDVSLIQMIANQDDGDNFEFPYTPLGDSDLVRVGDWALAMGNPFILTEDQYPTVTMGIVSGVKRYQSGAGKNELVYGNCIQVDSSINPGNSGGPLFNMSGEVIGINGRGSFQDRGRVNVGLGYAISSNQIKNFIPELLATKLVEHGTLDANFSDRGGRVVCSALSTDSPAAKAGLALGDQMLEFEGVKIKTANQFTNLICTLPEGWPARLKIRKADDSEVSIQLRLLGLPYKQPKMPPPPKNKDEEEKPNKQPTQEEKQKLRRLEMIIVLSAEPGTVRDRGLNRTYVCELLDQWQRPMLDGSLERCWRLDEDLVVRGQSTQTLKTWLCADGRFIVECDSTIYFFDGDEFFQKTEELTQLTPVEAKIKFEILQAIALTAGFGELPFAALGDTLIDGADLCENQRAYRFSVKDEAQDPFYFWLTGILYGDRPMRLSKCAGDLNGKDGSVVLEKWKALEDSKIEFPLVRKNVRGLDSQVIATITNVSTTKVAFEEFEKLLATMTEPEQPTQKSDGEAEDE